MSLIAALLFTTQASAVELNGFVNCPPPNPFKCLGLQDNDGAILPDDWIQEALAGFEKTTPAYLKVTIDVAQGRLAGSAAEVPLDGATLSYGLSTGERWVYFVPVYDWYTPMKVSLANVGEGTAMFNVYVDMATEAVP